MRVGIPTETKNNEFRVAITPAGVAELTRRGHEVFVQAGAGEGSAITDADFKAAGAQLISTADRVWADADLLLKVKEPVPAEYAPAAARPDPVHLSAPGRVARLHRGAAGIRHDVDRLRDGPDRRRRTAAAGPDERGRRSALRSGRGLSPDAHPRRPRRADGRGAGCRARRRRGRSARGTAGYNAARVASGMGATVTVFDVNINKLRQLDAEFGGQVRTRYSSAYELEGAVKRADLVIGAVLVPGAKAPNLISNSLVAQMKPGAVLVDIAIDQGGCFEDSRPDHPRRPDLRGARHGVLLRGEHAQRGAQDVDVRADQRDDAVRARLADRGWQAACRSDHALAKGLSTHDGALLSEQVATDLGLQFTDPAAVLG